MNLSFKKILSTTAASAILLASAIITHQAYAAKDNEPLTSGLQTIASNAWFEVDESQITDSGDQAVLSNSKTMRLLLSQIITDESDRDSFIDDYLQTKIVDPDDVNPNLSLGSRFYDLNKLESTGNTELKKYLEDGNILEVFHEIYNKDYLSKYNGKTYPELVLGLTRDILNDYKPIKDNIQSKIVKSFTPTKDIYRPGWKQVLENAVVLPSGTKVKLVPHTFSNPTTLDYLDYRLDIEAALSHAADHRDQNFLDDGIALNYTEFLSTISSKATTEELREYYVSNNLCPKNDTTCENLWQWSEDNWANFDNYGENWILGLILRTLTKAEVGSTENNPSVLDPYIYQLSWRVVHEVGHKFESSVPSVKLPHEVTSLTPAPFDATEGSDVIPCNGVADEHKPCSSKEDQQTPIQRTVTVADSPLTWHFNQWKDSTITIGSDEESNKFVGSWDPYAPLSYEFKKAKDTDPELPEEVKNLTPAETSSKVGEKVTPSTPTQTTVTNEDGTWSFVEYKIPTGEGSSDPGSETSLGSDGKVSIEPKRNKLVGYWRFTPKPAVTHEFKSSVPELALPQQVNDLLPSDFKSEPGVTVIPCNGVADSMKPCKTREDETPIERSVKEEDSPVTWKFNSWDKSSIQVSAESENKFVGSWDPYAPLSYEFKKAKDSDPVLPEQVTSQLPPASSEVKVGSMITPGEPEHTTVTTSEGTWTFKHYKNGDTPVASDGQVRIEGKENKLVGYWEYTPPAPPASEPATPEPGDPGSSGSGEQPTPVAPGGNDNTGDGNGSSDGDGNTGDGGVTPDPKPAQPGGDTDQPGGSDSSNPSTPGDQSKPSNPEDGDTSNPDTPGNGSTQPNDPADPADPSQPGQPGTSGETNPSQPATPSVPGQPSTPDEDAGNPENPVKHLPADPGMPGVKQPGLAQTGVSVILLTTSMLCALMAACILHTFKRKHHT